MVTFGLWGHLEAITASKKFAWKNLDGFFIFRQRVLISKKHLEIFNSTKWVQAKKCPPLQMAHCRDLRSRPCCMKSALLSFPSARKQSFGVSTFRTCYRLEGWFWFPFCPRPARYSWIYLRTISAFELMGNSVLAVGVRVVESDKLIND